MTEEQPIPQTDADVVREVFPATGAPELTEPRRGPGRPKGSKRLTAAQRSEQARRAGLARAAKERERAAAPPVEVSVERKLFWGKRMQKFWNQLAGLRGYDTIPDDQEVLQEIGDPLARTMDQLVPMVDDRPWLQLVFVMAPLLGGAAIVEFRQWRERSIDATGGRAPSPDGPVVRDERGGLRPQGEREKQPPEEYLGTPIGG